MVISNSRTAPPDTGRRFRIFYQSVIVRVTDVVPLLIFGIFVVMAYGMVSELVKLNLYYDRSKNRSRSGSDFYFLLPSRDDCYLTFSTEAIVPSKGSTSDNAPV